VLATLFNVTDILLGMMVSFSFLVSN